MASRFEQELHGIKYIARPDPNNDCQGCVGEYDHGLCNSLCADESKYCADNEIIWLVSKEQSTSEQSPVTQVKETNPKDSVGIKKAPLSVVPTQVLHEIGLGMLEGALKYGRHNYRVAGVRASVYYDATMRHLNQWWEGEDIDRASQLSHITKALSSLSVLRDSMLQENWTDDRPPPAKNKDWLEDYNAIAARLIENYPEPKPAFTKDSNGQT